MYDDLVKRIHEQAVDLPEKFSKNAELLDVLMKAADAIKELTAYVRQIEELRKDGYYLQKTKMMTYGQATMTMPLPEPPKEETIS